jgi:hypothetical protein
LSRPDDYFNNNKNFYLRVSEHRRICIDSRWGVLKDCDNSLLYPARAVS